MLYRVSLSNYEQASTGTHKMCRVLLVNPDFATLAKAFGLPYIETSGGLPDRWDNPDGPVLINCLIEGRTIVSPKLEYNHPIDQPSPQLDAEEFDRFMKTEFPNS